MTWETQDIAPIGTRPTAAIVCRSGGRGGPMMVDVDVYPPNPEGEALAGHRRDLGIVLRKAAATLGLSPSILSAIEHGSKRFANPADYERAKVALSGGAT